MATILVVDDISTNRDLLATLLGYSGHHLLQAADGTEALRLIRAEHPDLVITDIFMPTMDGYELVRQLRADPAIAATRVIFYTAAYLEAEVREVARPLGIFDLVLKPTEPQTILNTVSRALDLPLQPARPAAAPSLPQEQLETIALKLSRKAQEVVPRLAALIELGQQLAAERDVAQLLQSFCHKAREIIGARYAAVGVLDDDGERLRHVVGSGLDAEVVARVGALPSPVGVLGTVVAEGRPVRLAELAGDPQAVGLPLEHPPIHTVLAVPLHARVQGYGWLYLAEKLGGEPFSEEEERLAVTLGAQFALAYENAHLLLEVQGHAAELETEIAERRRMQEALAESERRFRALAEYSTDAIALVDAHGSVIYSTPSTTSVLGIAPDQMKGQSGFHGLHPDDLPAAYDVFDQLLRQPGMTMTTQVRYLQADGAWHWIEATVTNLLGQPGIDAIVANYRDITERKQAEEALRSSEARKTAILQSALDCIITIDHTGSIIEFNPAAEKTFGYSRDVALGQELASLIIPPAWRDAHRKGLAHYLATGEGPVIDRRIELPAMRADGTEFPVDLAITRISETGPPVFTGFLRDISERKQTEEALQQSKEELERRVSERTAELANTNVELRTEIIERQRVEEALHLARAEAEQANRAKSDFLSRMSHELRTPMNAILGFAQLLEMGTLPIRQTEEVRQILKGGRHLLALINEVLDISRIEAGHIHLSLEPVAVPDLVHEVLDLVQPLAAHRTVSLDLVGPCDYYIWADRQRIVQVLLNLLSNAVKYNREAGAVTLTCEPAPDDRLRLLVQDTGPGLTPAQLTKLFTPFERLGAEQTEVEGTGLGLALSKRLVEAMGGELGVSSTPGQGSTFWVTLQQVEQPVKRLGQQAASEQESSDEPGDLRTILYIEDNLSNLRLIEHILADQPAMRLLSAMQGAIGLDLAREHRPDLILLDLHLPDMPGDKVLQLLQEDPLTRTIPVVMLSADALPRTSKRLLASGARMYLTKPLNVLKFRQAVNQILTTGGDLDNA